MAFHTHKYICTTHIHLKVRTNTQKYKSISVTCQAIITEIYNFFLPLSICILFVLSKHLGWSYTSDGRGDQNNCSLKVCPVGSFASIGLLQQSIDFNIRHGGGTQRTSCSPDITLTALTVLEKPNFPTDSTNHPSNTMILSLCLLAQWDRSPKRPGNSLSTSSLVKHLVSSDKNSLPTVH